MSLVCEDIDISHYSPINSIASIVIKSNPVPPEALSFDDLSIDNVSNFSGRGDICLSVKPLQPENIAMTKDVENSAIRSLYGVMLDGSKQQGSCSLIGEKITSSIYIVGEPSKDKISGNKHHSFVPKPSLSWRAINKKRGIIHHPECASPRVVFIADDTNVTPHPFPTPGSIKSLKAYPAKCKCKPPDKRNWRRNKDDRAPLWKPRHEIISKNTRDTKITFSTIRTVKM
jgi:hypothetical protein